MSQSLRSFTDAPRTPETLFSAPPYLLRDPYAH
jgi:hypothetical protein